MEQIKGHLLPRVQQLEVHQEARTMGDKYHTQAGNAQAQTLCQSWQTQQTIQ